MDFKVHRVVLGPKSPVFMAAMDKEGPMLIRDVDSGTLQVCLNLHDIDSRDNLCFKVLLRFMYSGRVDVDNINPAKIMKLITASDLYQVK